MNYLELVPTKFGDYELTLHDELDTDGRDLLRQCIYSGSIAFVSQRLRNLLDQWTIKPDEIPWSTKHFDNNIVYIKVLGVYVLLLEGWKDVIKEMGMLWRICAILDGMVKRDILGSFELEIHYASMDMDDEEFEGYDNQRRYERMMRVVAYLENRRVVRPEMEEEYDGDSSDECLEDSIASEYYDRVFSKNWRRWQRVLDAESADDINLVQLVGPDYNLPKKDNGWTNYNAILVKDVDRANLPSEYQYGRKVYTGIDLRPNQSRIKREGQFRTVVSPILKDFKGLQDLVYYILNDLTHEDLRKEDGGKDDVIWRSKLITNTIPGYWNDDSDLIVRFRLIIKRVMKVIDLEDGGQQINNRFDLYIVIHLPDINHLMPRVKAKNACALMMRIGMHQRGNYTMGGVMKRILEWKHREGRMMR